MTDDVAKINGERGQWHAHIEQERWKIDLSNPTEMNTLAPVLTPGVHKTSLKVIVVVVQLFLPFSSESSNSPFASSSVS